MHWHCISALHENLGEKKNWYTISLHLSYKEQGHTVLYAVDSQTDISNLGSFPECQTQIWNFLYDIFIWSNIMGIYIFMSSNPDSWHLTPKMLLLRPFPSKSTILSVIQVKNLKTTLLVSFSQPRTYMHDPWAWTKGELLEGMGYWAEGGETGKTGTTNRSHSDLSFALWQQPLIELLRDVLVKVYQSFIYKKVNIYCRKKKEKEERREEK